MKGLLYILLAYLTGEGLSMLIGGFVPGSILGMLILFGALQTKLIKAEDVKGAAGFLLDNMLLFFVPVSVGLIASYKLIGANMLAITAILVLTTMLVVAVVGLVQQKIGRRKDDR